MALLLPADADEEVVVMGLGPLGTVPEADGSSAVAVASSQSESQDTFQEPDLDCHACQVNLALQSKFVFRYMVRKFSIV
jgi:hypothetical protein